MDGKPIARQVKSINRCADTSRTLCRQDILRDAFSSAWNIEHMDGSAQTIIVAIDDSDASRRAVEVAAVS
jgi:hypothetical protein